MNEPTKERLERLLLLLLRGLSDCVFYSFGQTDRRLRRSTGCEASAAAFSFSLSLSLWYWRQEKRVKPTDSLPACRPRGSAPSSTPHLAG